MRKSKFDMFIVYCPKKKRIIRISWDYAVDGLQRWWHSDGSKTWHIEDNKYISKIPELFILLYRLPEGWDGL